MRYALLDSIYSGELFLEAGLLFAAIALADLPGLPNFLTRAARLLALLAIGLAALSAPPLPLPLAIIALAAGLTFVFWSFGKRTKLARIVTAMAGLASLGAVAADLPSFMSRSDVPRPDRLFVIGDSLSSGGFGEQRTWPAVIEASTTIPVTNLSLASGDTATALQRQIPLLPSPAARECVLIEIGGNDMLDGVDPELFANNLDRILDSAAAGGRRSVVMLELPLLPGRWSYGAAQRRLAKKHRCELVPKRLLAHVLLTPENTSDGLHLTQRGHDALARQLLQWLRW